MPIKLKYVFLKRKNGRCLFNWKINNAIIETIDEFCYLGITFHHTGTMSKTVKALNVQALKAYNRLYLTV